MTKYLVGLDGVDILERDTATCMIAIASDRHRFRQRTRKSHWLVSPELQLVRGVYSMRSIISRLRGLEVQKKHDTVGRIMTKDELRLLC